MGHTYWMPSSIVHLHTSTYNGIVHDVHVQLQFPYFRRSIGKMASTPAIVDIATRCYVCYSTIHYNMLAVCRNGNVVCALRSIWCATYSYDYDVTEK